MIRWAAEIGSLEKAREMFVQQVTDRDLALERQPEGDRCPEGQE